MVVTKKRSKMDIKVIATDMDGTLLDPKGQLDSICHCNGK